MSCEYVFLDCFGVLYDEIGPVVLKETYGEEKAIVIRSSLFPLLDLGEITLEEGWERIASTYGGSKEELREKWKRHVRLRPEIPGLLKRLAKRYRLVLVSNAPKGLVEHFFETNGLKDLFYALFISSEFCLAKPTSEFFSYVESSLELLDKTRVAYFDDSKINIEAGIKRGYRSFLVGEGGLESAVNEFLKLEGESHVAI